MRDAASSDLSTGSSTGNQENKSFWKAGLFPLTEVDGLIDAARIAAAPGDMAWVVKEDGSVHTLHPDLTWTQAHNGFVTTDIGVGANGAMKLVDDQGMVHAFNVGGVLWQDVPTGFFVSKIAVDANGFAWVANYEGFILVEVDGGTGWHHLDRADQQHSRRLAERSCWQDALRELGDP